MFWFGSDPVPDPEFAGFSVTDHSFTSDTNNIFTFSFGKICFWHFSYDKMIIKVQLEMIFLRFSFPFRQKRPWIGRSRWKLLKTEWCVHTSDSASHRWTLRAFSSRTKQVCFSLHAWKQEYCDQNSFWVLMFFEYITWTKLFFHFIVNVSGSIYV